MRKGVKPSFKQITYCVHSLNYIDIAKMQITVYECETLKTLNAGFIYEFKCVIHCVTLLIVTIFILCHNLFCCFVKARFNTQWNLLIKC